MNVCGFLFSNRYKTNSLELAKLQRHTSAFYLVRVSCVFIQLLNISVTVCNSGHFLNCGETFGSKSWLWLMHCTCKHCLRFVNQRSFQCSFHRSLERSVFAWMFYSFLFYGWTFLAKNRTIIRIFLDFNLAKRLLTSFFFTVGGFTLDNLEF